MQPDYSRIWPYLIAILAVWAIYRRFRRNFGRQPLRPLRMSARSIILAVLGFSLVPLALKSGEFLAAECAGLGLGTALGVWGARRTRYQTYDGQLHYLPHTYTGVAVSLLFFGRLVYRLAEWYAKSNAPDAAATAEPSASASGFIPPPMVRSPFTVALFFVLIGYYVCYYSMVLWKSKRIVKEDLEAAPAAPSS
jgi:hypothetical protein